MLRIFGKVFLAVLFFSFSSSLTFAQTVVINEFLANPTTPAKEWVEFYNPSHIDLALYWLDDDPNFDDDSGNSSKKNLASLNNNNQDFPYLEFSSFLNNSGDYVVLFTNEGSVIDQYQYTSDPGKDVSIGRNPDGLGNFGILVQQTIGQPNSSETIVPTPSPSPITSSNQPTPTSVKATYKINEVKDKSGNILSNVKVYIDNIYSHHYAPEILTFCGGCRCDSEIDCGFGSHNIMLEKNGFKNWTDSKAINSGDNYEVNPILEVASSPQQNTPSVSTISPSPVPTKSSTSRLVSTSSAGKILSTAASTMAAMVGGTATVAGTTSSLLAGSFENINDDNPQQPKPWIQPLLVLALLAIVGMATSAFWIRRKRKGII